MKVVAPERTGWRDAEMSERHRQWGFNCPAVDIDFFMIEYNHAEPVALVDYKHHQRQEKHSNPRHPSFRAMATLANRAQIPAWIATYWPDYFTFVVTPLNKRARELFGDDTETPLSEREYVRYLYRIRHFVAAKPLMDSLHDRLSPAAVADSGPF